MTKQVLVTSYSNLFREIGMKIKRVIPEDNERPKKYTY